MPSRKLPPGPPPPVLPGLFDAPAPQAQEHPPARTEFFGKSRDVDALRYLHSNRHFWARLAHSNAELLHDAALGKDERARLKVGSYEYRQAMHDRFWNALKRFSDVHPLGLPKNATGWIDESQAVSLYDNNQSLLEHRLSSLGNAYIPLPVRADPSNPESLAKAELRPHFRYMQEICDAYIEDVKKNAGVKPHSDRLEELSRVLRDFRTALDVHRFVEVMTPFIEAYQREAQRDQPRALQKITLMAQDQLRALDAMPHTKQRMMRTTLESHHSHTSQESLYACCARVANAASAQEAMAALGALDHFSRTRAFYAAKNMAQAYVHDIKAISDAEGRERKRSDILSPNPFNEESVVVRAGFEAAVSLSARHLLHRYRANQKTIETDNWDEKIGARKSPPPLPNVAGEGAESQGTVHKATKGRARVAPKNDSDS